MTKCKHQVTVGSVGAKMHFCLECKHKIENVDYEEERAMIENAKAHPKSTHNPLSVAIRRAQKIESGEATVVSFDEVLKKLNKRK